MREKEKEGENGDGYRSRWDGRNGCEKLEHLIAITTRIIQTHTFTHAHVHGRIKKGPPICLPLTLLSSASLRNPSRQTLQFCHIRELTIVLTFFLSLSPAYVLRVPLL